jgi:outer membrane lipoprotein SlyB
MRTSRITTLAGATAMAALLAACGSNPTQPAANSYPSTSVGSYPSTTTYPSSSSYPAGTTVQNAPAAAVETGRVTDIQTVQMGATSSTNPGIGRAVVGGIIGAVVGSAIGKNVDNGHSRAGATVLGAAGGAAIGNRTGQNAEANTASSGAGGPAYRVTVQTDQGAWRTFEVGALGDLRVGDRVRVENNVIYRAS